MLNSIDDENDWFEHNMWIIYRMDKYIKNEKTMFKFKSPMVFEEFSNSPLCPARG